HLEQLSTRARESASVAVLDGDEVVYVARVPTKRIMAVAIAIGTRFPAHATSLGRVLLAGQGPEWLAGYLAGVKLRPLTPYTIVDRDELRAELQRVSEQGYALADQQLEEGLRSMAAPIRDADGTVIAGVNVSAHISRGSGAALHDELLPLLREAASSIETDLREIDPEPVVFRNRN
ncbi:MAG: IclR family transcriptional regulator domain-containing protein, partial [Stackebrandtia sp.]